MGKIFIWGLMILVIGGIGYYMGYNHTTLPILKDFAIVRTSDLKKLDSLSPTKAKEVITEAPEATQSATPSAAIKSPTPTE